MLAVAGRQWLALARSVAPVLHEILRKASKSVLFLQPCLRDARPEHFLFEQDRLSGIVDFGAMGMECVAGDLARLIGDWLGGDPNSRAQALTAYERIRPLAPAETSLIPVFESSADLLIGERWLHWHLLEGRVFEDPQAVSKGLARGLKRLERLALDNATCSSSLNAVINRCTSSWLRFTLLIERPSRSHDRSREAHHSIAGRRWRRRNGRARR